MKQINKKQAIKENKSYKIEEFHTIFQALPGAYLILKPDKPYFTIIDVCEAFLKATATKRKEIIGKSIFNIFPDYPEDPKSTTATHLSVSLERVYRTKKPHQMPIDKYKIESSKNKIVEKYWSPLNIPVIRDKQLIYIVHAIVDVTEKVNIENTLRYKEKELYFQKDNLEYLSEASKILASSLDYRTTLESVGKLAVPKIADWISIDMLENGKIEQLVVANRDPKKVEWAKQLRKLNPPNLNDPMGLPRVLRMGKSELYPVITDEMLKISTKTKKQYLLAKKIGFRSVMLVPIISAKKTIGAITFVTTETNRHYSKSDLSVAEELATRASLAIENSKLYQQASINEIKYKAFVDSNIVGVIIADGEGNIMEANDCYLNITGHLRNDLTRGKLNRWELTPLEYREIDKKAMQELSKFGRSSPYEKELIKKDGSQVPVIVASSLIDKKTGEHITIILDITERKRLEQRKDEFIGIASHELKTPLTSIKGYVQILERIIEEMGSEKARIIVSKTNTYIDRLNSLISDLLDVSKIQAGKLQLNRSEFDIGNLIDEAIDSIQATTLSHKIIKKNTLSARVYGDKHRLEQVLLNLLSNAVKYSPKEDEVIIDIKKNTDKVIISVTDFGIGIPKSHHTRLFQRFYRIHKTANQFSGLGIGLFISSEIVKRHGGDIWVNNNRGRGTTFLFSLPLSIERKQKYG